jgi:4-amino-4-deoxy-L-arabinose transferase-like glycosyltransferase
LLAAWTFIKATESGKLTWLLLGAFIVGLGFNIKMMQAFLPLPAFYALYFFGSKEAWLRKIINLGIATILLVAVSLSWAVVVDLTPTSQRPYIGSSGNNTVMGLIFGHNGISRLESTGGPGGGTPPSAPMAGSNPNQGIQPQDATRQGPPQQAVDACASSTQGASCSFTTQNGNTINGSCITPPNQNVLACAPQGMMPQQNGQSPLMQAGGPNGQGSGAQFSNETGEPGVFRFFTQPLSKQMSWLLPFALISVLLALFGSKIKLPIESGIHKALLLWGGWLLTCVVFFSMVSGIFHSYYAIMLAPALGAMVGIGFTQLWSWGKEKNWAGILLILASAITLGFQYFAMNQYGESLWWMLPAGILFVAGISLMVARSGKRFAYVTLLSAILIIPMYWTVMTVASSPNINLPTAYTGSSQQNGLRPAMQVNGLDSNANDKLLTYLEANTQDVNYLAAVPSSQQGSSLVLATGRPVLYMGGFGGQDEVVTADDLSAMVANGELRYIIYGSDRGGKTDIANWLSASCSVVQEFRGTSSDNQGPGNQATTLYMCK